MIELEIPSKNFLYLQININMNFLVRIKGKKKTQFSYLFIGVKLPLLSGILEAFPNSNLTFGLSSPNF
jgi:hypothetical protein